MTKYTVRREGTIEIEASTAEEAKEMANEKGESLWDWGDCEVDD